MRVVALVLVIAFLALGARAQKSDAFVPIEVRVIGVAGPLVTLDLGAAAGLRVGDRLRLKGELAGVRTGIVTVVEAESARAELDLGAGENVVAAIGQRGEVLVPASRAVGAAPVVQREVRDDVPEHPPWTAPVDGFDADGPLLAPAKSPEPEDRAPVWSGRFFTRLEGTSDETGDVERKYLRSWSGVDVRGENPFGLGGLFRFRGDLSYRDSSIDGESDSETLARIDRLSYAHGGRVDDRWRVEVGRFLHSEFAQFGVIDGVELVHQFRGGSRLGASVGGLPQWLDGREYDSDSQAALFYRWASGLERTVEVGIGYQKTWHRSEADRDFLVGTFDARLAQRTSLRASAGVDYYDDSEFVKDQGFELTESFVSLDHRFEAPVGVGLYGSYFRFPELQREQFPAPPIEVLRAQRVARVGTNAWWTFTDGVTVRGRLEGWEDQEDAGGDADLRLDLRDVIAKGGELSLGGFYTKGKWSSWLGGRIGWTQWIDASTLRVAWEPAWIDENGLFGEEQQLFQHQIGAALDSSLNADTDLTVYVDRQLGDEQDAWIGGVRLQWRF